MADWAEQSPWMPPGPALRTLPYLYSDNETDRDLMRLILSREWTDSELHKILDGLKKPSGSRGKPGPKKGGRRQVLDEWRQVANDLFNLSTEGGKKKGKEPTVEAVARAIGERRGVDYKHVERAYYAALRRETRNPKARGPRTNVQAAE